MKKQFVFLFLFATVFVFGQECNCSTYYNWIKKTFEANDAGYETVLKSKGEEAYQLHNALIERKVEKTSDLHECVKILRSWTGFFRKGHIEVGNINTPPNSKDVFSYDLNLNTFKKYLTTKKTQDIEGVWSFYGSEIVFKKVNDQYLGIVAKSNDTLWKRNEVKFVIDKDGTGEYYNSEKSKWHLKKFQLLSIDLLKINSNIFLKRTYLNDKTNTKKVDKLVKILEATKPSAYQFNEDTYYIRLPSFHHTQKKSIDSVIAVHKNKIASTENLIIDIRGNGGGSDTSYEELLPFIYTNPIRKPGFEFYATKLNNQRTLDIIDGAFGEQTEEAIQNYKKRYEILSANVGSYVNFESETKVATIVIDTPTTFPKKVAVVVDEGVASSAEEFMMAAKQSEKVKMYGVTTMGALDLANQYYTFSPDKEVILVYTLSRRINNMPVDDVGIQPDFFLDASIERYNWLQYVANKL